MFSRDPVTVAVPATSANLGPGFDSLGLALSLTDEVTARVTDAGCRVEVTGEGAGEVPTGEDHLIVSTMLATFDALGSPRPPGLALTCDNRIPHARGLGSSSAAIVAGILLARALVRNDRALVQNARALVQNATALDEAGVLRLASAIEGHPDNVAPCILGGFTIAWTDTSGARAVRLEVAPGVRLVVVIPTKRGLTAEARTALPATVPHVDAAFNAGRAALLVHALTADPGLLLEATDDRLHQGYRAPGMPETAALVRSLRASGVPAVVSGAGPSVLAMLPPDVADDAWEVSPEWCVRSLSVSGVGGRILDDRHAEGDPVAAGLPG